MIRNFGHYLLLFLIPIVLQLFVLNNIQLSGYINPYVYLIAILLLPYETPGGVLLLAAFLVGFIIDISMSTLGIHSSATLFMAFLRPYVLSSLTTRDDVERKGAPTMALNGVGWSIRYTLILVLTHHIILFYLEVFSFSGFFLTLWRVLLSTLFTSLFILIAQYYFLRNKE